MITSIALWFVSHYEPDISPTGRNEAIALGLLVCLVFGKVGWYALTKSYPSPSFTDTVTETVTREIEQVLVLRYSL